MKDPTLEDFTTNSTLLPSGTPVHGDVLLGCAELAVKNFEKSLKHFESAIARDPEVPIAWLGKALAEVESADPPDLEGSIFCLEQALRPVGNNLGAVAECFVKVIIASALRKFIGYAVDASLLSDEAGLMQNRADAGAALGAIGTAAGITGVIGSRQTSARVLGAGVAAGSFAYAWRQICESTGSARRCAARPSFCSQYSLPYSGTPTVLKCAASA